MSRVGGVVTVPVTPSQRGCSNRRPYYGDYRLPERFWEKVYPCPITGCWLWGAKETSGYGVFRWDGRTQKAHRVAYEELVAKVVLNLDLDHLCRVRACVNPDHLEPVTRSENLRRGDAGKNLVAINAGKTHCPQGHLYGGENLYVSPEGWRCCRTCVAASGDRYRARKAIEA